MLLAVKYRYITQMAKATETSRISNEVMLFFSIVVSY